MNANDFELFKGTSFSDLMKDIYHNSKMKARQIDQLIESLKPLVKSTGDAVVIVPLIKEYLDVSVKNDDALVKLAAIVQRILSSTGTATDSAGEFILSDEERARLLEEAEEEIKVIQIKQGTNG